jgi:Xaa-Pro aminopeptidase
MDQRQIDMVIVTQTEHVQWLAGPRLKWVFSPAAALSADGHLTLVCPREPAVEVAAADQIVTYPALWHGTLRNDQPRASSEALLDAVRSRPKPSRTGVEFSNCPRHLTAAWAGDIVDIEPDFYRLRRRKDADELACLRKAISGTEKMYQRAREIVRPGVSELEVFNQLQSVAVDEFGEMMTETGNDYQCGAPGGPPRDRQARAGELYILDLGPAYRGYFADNCRTIAVTEATDDQRRAWDYIERVFGHIEQCVRPGIRARPLFQEVQAMLDESPVGRFHHHLGHGIGLFPHEGPHLNPHWDDTFEVGDVFTAEPGLYDADRLKAGIRIENDYLVTEGGVELLSDFPRQL